MSGCSDLKATFRLTEEEKALAAMFAPDAERLARWYSRGKPEHRYDDILYSAAVGCCKGAHSARRRLGDDPEPDQLRKHMAKNVRWQMQKDFQLIMKKIDRRSLVCDAMPGRHAKRGYTEVYAEDYFEGAASEILVATQQVDPVETRDSAEHALRVMDFILTEKQRHIVNGILFRNESAQELGSEMGVGSQNIYDLYRRAIEKLRAHFGVNEQEN